MKNYILLIGVAGVALGSYAAYAGNSATMTVTATIAHDVSLNVTQNIDFGTITINPAYDKDDTVWQYSDSGVISYTVQGEIVSAPNITVGTFTANIPNPTACNTASDSCGGLTVAGSGRGFISSIFGTGNVGINMCNLSIKYSGSENIFKVFPDSCYIYDRSIITTGTHTGTLTISYTPS
ncbi:MAG: hypothetical protein IJ689_07040 [Alphaproteobacteria bacterium]|nr:hypothetical protein [Alphaproteobacteria bacterium]